MEEPEERWKVADLSSVVNFGPALPIGSGEKLGFGM
jgi:hypothetical protein